MKLSELLDRVAAERMTLTDCLIGIFIAAARNAAVWPQPSRKLAQQALASVPAEHFEPEIAAALLAREERLN